MIQLFPGKTITTVSYGTDDIGFPVVLIATSDGHITTLTAEGRDVDLEFTINVLPSPEAPQTTPAAHWREKGEPDPHGTRYACERAALLYGNLTDDEVANAVYLCDHRSSFASIGYLTAAKDRIRWLSRALVEATK